MGYAPVTGLVLGGGLGSRLRSAFAQGPKVLAPVAGRPFVTYLLDQLKASGIGRVVLCTGYLAQTVRDALGNQYEGLSLVHSPEGEPLGTGGALRKALPLIESDLVLALNGDSWCDFHLPTMLATQRAHKAAGVICLVSVDDAGRFGKVELGADQVIKGFGEKTPGGPRLVNAGAYLLSRPLLESIAPDCFVSLEREVFPRWVGRGLVGWVAGRYFLDIGTPDSYAGAEAFMARALGCCARRNSCGLRDKNSD